MQKKTLAISLAAVIGAAATASIVYAQTVPQGPSRAEFAEQAERAFDRMDANLDGQIDASDRAGAQAANLRARFDTADSNGDGALAFEEFSAAREHRLDKVRDGRGGHRERGDGGRRAGRSMFLLGAAMSDTNGDGAITQPEFNAAALGHFDRGDANDDGVLTREEGRALRQALRAEAQGRMRQASPAAQGS